jgi:septum formation protein
MPKTSFHNKNIILASKSERRINLLKDLKVPFKAIESPFKEPDFETTDMSPAEYAINNAKQKAAEVAKKASNAFIIGMDTIGEYNGRVLGKPKDRSHAKDMIKYLNGTTHNVITGICIKDADSEHEVTAAEITHVTFAQMSNNDIELYLDLGAWKDMAAGYAIQGIGSLFVEKIEGDYFNVVGFPIYRFSHLMKEIGMPLLEIMTIQKSNN